MLHREVYERTPQFEDRVAGARLRTYEWQFLASLDGKATVGEILRRLKIDEPTIAEFIFEQERNGAIAPRLISLEEFLSSPESAPAAAENEPAAPRRPSAGAQLKRTAGEELRAIARLSSAAAIGEVVSLIGKRRVAPPAEAPSRAKAAPAAPAQPAAPAAPAPVVDAAPPAESAPATVPANEVWYDRDDLSSFEVFDWTLPVRPPAVEAEAAAPVEPAVNGLAAHELEIDLHDGLDEADVDYLHAFAEEPVVFEDGLTIADRLLRDYGPIDATEAPPGVRFDAEPLAEAALEFPAPQAHEPLSTYVEPAPEPAVEPAPPFDGSNAAERDAHRVTFSVNDLAGYIERIEPAPAKMPDLAAYEEPAEPAPAHAAEAVEAVPPEPAQAIVRALVAEPEEESAETIDPSLTDPIVFSLSARNPDSFWSGKK